MSNAPDTGRFEATSIRDEFIQCHTGDEVVAVITDPENPLAWIRSSHTVEVTP